MAIQLSYVEKDVEDLLEEDCEDFVGLKFVARQFRTPVGVIDVVARARTRCRLYFVIEIKKDLLDSAAYVQVVRYANWLNSELSKGGQRLFIPLLVGPRLHPELSTICEHLASQSGWFDLIGRVFYKLFKFDPRRGVTFDWVNNAQQDHSRSLTHRYSHIHSLWQRADRLTGENYRIRNGLSKEPWLDIEDDEDFDDDVETQPMLELVKCDGDAA